MYKLIQKLQLIILIFLLTGCSLNAGYIINTDNAIEYSTSTGSKGLKPVQGELNILFLDVQQGASQLIIGPSGKVILIDAGDNNQKARVLKYLKQYGVKKIDILIGTHPDADHIGGLSAVIDNLEVAKIYMPKYTKNTKTYETLLRSIQNKGLKISTAKAGITLDWEPDVQAELLGPVKNNYEEANDHSAVLKLKYKNRTALLTGDAEFKSENDMLKAGKDLSAELLLVAHHGSAGATSSRFLKAVNPKIGVIQVGEENKYGHPTEKTINRLKKQNVTIYRNDVNGTVLAVTTKDKWSISSER